MCCFKSTFLSIHCEPSALVDLEWLNIPQKKLRSIRKGGKSVDEKIKKEEENKKLTIPNNELMHVVCFERCWWIMANSGI